MDTVKLKTIPESRYIAGVDEAGRGPLAGPVVASAVILDPSQPIEGLDDSKKLTELQRDKLAIVIRERAIAWAVAYSDVEEIDRLNILQATLVAMLRAVSRLKVQPAHIQVDGNKLPDISGLPFPCTAEAIVEGDALIPAISAASILAKTSRDAMMMKLDEQHPGYGFEIHKGYGTAMHMRALQELGPCAIHRKTFAPVKAMLAGEVVE
jgi:ribonuclease HII